MTPQQLNSVAREVRSIIRANVYAETGEGFDQTLPHDLEQFDKTFSHPVHAVGRMPPEPPTLRGRVGGVLVRLVRRCLFWYSEQINELSGKIGGLFGRLGVQLARLERESAGQRHLVQDVAGQLVSLNRATKTIREDINSTQVDLDVTRKNLLRDFEAVLRTALTKEGAAVRQEFDVALQNERRLLHNHVESKLHAALEKERGAAKQEFDAMLENERRLLHSDLESKLKTALEKERAAARQEALVALENDRLLLHSDVESKLQMALEKERAAIRQGLDAALEDNRRLLQEDLESKLQVVVERERATVNHEIDVALKNDRLLLNIELEPRMAALRDSVNKAEMLVHQTRAILYAQESRISLLIRKSHRAPEDSAPLSLPEIASDVRTDELGELYLAFENAFRGSRGEIKERFSEYLPLLKSKQIGTPQMPVLDLGCGRGEWLEILGENYLTSLGVDSNASCTHECQIRGLNVVKADLLSFLEQLPEQSQGALTAFHVVEHLPFRTILHFLDEAVRVLKPGGVLILETPNPANLIVGANTFYLDPTHVRQLPAELLRFFVESRGFSGAEVRPLHPFPDSYRLDGDANSAATVLNDLIYGARDYAIIAERA